MAEIKKPTLDELCQYFFELAKKYATTKQGEEEVSSLEFGIKLSLLQEKIQDVDKQDKKIAELHTNIRTLGENLRLQNIAMEELKGERNILKQENSKLEKMEYKSITINDYFESTDKMLKEIYNLITTKMADFLKDGHLYSKVGVMEVLGSVFGYVDTFVKGKDFHCQDQKGVREAELNRLREFAKVMANHKLIFPRLKDASISFYDIAKKDSDKDFDLVKGVVEDYGTN